MPLDTIQNEITNLPEDDYQQVRRWMIGPERRRRQEESGKAELVLEEREAGIRDAPAAAVPEDQADNLAAYSDWKNPGVIHDRMYGLGDRVRHDGRIWESTTPGLNHWEPGSPGVWDNVWRDITDELQDETETEPLDTPEPSAEESTEPVEDPEQVTPEPEQPDEGPTEPAEEPDQDPPAVPEWRAGMTVIPGEQVSYQGTVYTVVQGHTTMAGWEPTSVPALFSAS